MKALRHVSLALVVLFDRFTSIKSGWIDKDTSVEHFQTISYIDDREFELVFSDEFNVPGRKFHDGSDPRWTAIHKNDYTNYALHYYNADLITTDNRGYLNISTVIQDITFTTKVKDPEGGPDRTAPLTKNYQSGMLQGKLGIINGTFVC